MVDKVRAHRAEMAERMMQALQLDLAETHGPREDAAGCCGRCDGSGACARLSAGDAVAPKDIPTI